MKKRIFSFMLALVMVCSLLPINILAASGYTTCASGTVSWQMIYDGPETYYWIDGDGEYCKLTATKSGSKYYVTLYRSAKSNGTELRYLRQDKSDDSGSAHEWSSASTKYTGGVLYKTGESGTGTGSGSDSGSGTGTDSGSTAAIIADGTYTATSNSTYKKDSETYSATVTITVSGGKITSVTGSGPVTSSDNKSYFNGWTPVVSTFVTVDAAYQAVYDAQVKSYGISFVPGAVDVTNLPTEQTATVGQIVTINEEPKRTGYAFDGWTSEDTEVTGNTFTMPAQDVTLTAQWTRDDSQTQDVHYTVIHDVDGSEAFLQQYHDTAWINEENPVIAITELDIAAQKYRGYALTGTEPEVLPANGDTVPTGTVLKVYYTKSTPTWTWEKNEDGDCIAAATFTYHDGSTETIDAAVTSSVTKEATCTENGEVLYTATAIIGTEEYTTTYTEAIPATHTLTKVEAKAATCEADGSIEYYICEVCGKLFADGEATAEITSEDTIVPAMGHDWDEGVVTTPATCEEDGVKTYTCKHDPSHTYTEVIPALGHEWGENGGACIRCGEEFPAKITSVNAKQMSEMVTAQVIVGEAKGKAVTYSIRQYADVVFGQTSAVYEKMKPLLRAMLNYGGYAQQYFGYNLDRLANAGLYETDTDPVLNEETPDLSKYASEKTVTEDTKGIQLMSASVLVDSETELRFYFGLEEGKTMDDYTFQLKNSTKELVCEEDAKGNHYVSIKGIKATELSSMFTVIVTPKEETEPAITFSYGVLTYVKTQLEYSKKEKTINMVKALYQYAQAAAAYVSKK